jgi:hypothetical protein
MKGVAQRPLLDQAGVATPKRVVDQPVVTP